MRWNTQKSIISTTVSSSTNTMPSHQKPRTSPKKKTREQQETTTTTTTTAAPPLTAQQLVQAADQAMHVQDPTQALTLYTAAVARAADDVTLQVDVFEKRAAVRVSLADQEGALEDYRAALELVKSASNGNDDDFADATVLERKAGLFMYMGQLSQGEDALTVYRQAIELLERALKLRQDEHVGDAMEQDDKESVNALQETRQQLATACCTVAELYLTDLCYEENAEQECESYIQQALKLTDTDGEPIVDALQTCASLKLSQSKGLEAVDFILRAFEKIRTGCEALATLVGMRESTNPDEATELMETEAVQKLPGFEFRCQTAKLLLECAAILKAARGDGGKDTDEREPKCVRAAVDVLGSLMAEDDEVIEIWHLIGEAFASMTPSNPKVVSHYWDRATEMLVSVKESLEQQLGETEDDEEEEELNQELEEVMCQLDSIKSKLEAIKASADEVDMEED